MTDAGTTAMPAGISLPALEDHRAEIANAAAAVEETCRAMCGLYGGEACPCRHGRACHAGVLWRDFGLAIVARLKKKGMLR
jgi:hypothetical protein